MDTTMQKYIFWKTNLFFDEETRRELSAFDVNSDKSEIEDRFYRELEFGTGGLRGIMGAGTNRLNKYTVGKATLGLGNYLHCTYGKEKCASRGVAIAYDTRNNSSEFAKTAADVLCGMDIKVYLMKVPAPTPQLSFNVKYLNCIAGIVITASHNPKEYNGYKVYDEYGCQLVPEQAEKITEKINEITDYSSICFTGNENYLNYIDTTDDYVSQVLKQSRSENKIAKNNLKIVYTPLHGTGYIPVKEALNRAGFENVIIVPEQSVYDGNFPTVATPNPEDKRALTLGIELAKKTGADIVLGTDPDCDRVGVAVKNGDEYSLLTGNQIGALLTDYIMSHTDFNKISKPAVIKTVVTSDLGAEIAKKHGAYVFSTLTGFKFIGEKITQFEKAKINNDNLRNYDFLLGYEESYGYLVGTHARDKDAVVASLLICEMCADHKNNGKSLLYRMEQLYEEFGYYYDHLDSFTLSGQTGLAKIKSIMNNLRSGSSPFDDTYRVIDFKTDVEAEQGFGLLPKSDVLKFVINDGSWIAVRPSGTEPKIKVYYSVKANNYDSAKKKFEIYQKTVKTALGIE